MSRHDVPCFTISVVAKMVEMHPQTIRHYERIGFIHPKRSAGKQRLYSLKDVEILNRIAALTRDMGVNLAGVEIILKLLNEMEKMKLEMQKEIENLRQEVKRK
jgi:MerR family transcriptional regulator/heat shock protein HspR